MKSTPYVPPSPTYGECLYVVFWTFVALFCIAIIVCTMFVIAYQYPILAIIAAFILFIAFIVKLIAKTNPAKFWKYYFKLFKKGLLKMNKPLKFSDVHTRNSHDWQYQVSDDGRHMFIANGKGVSRRCGLVILALQKAGQGMTCREIFLTLRRRNATYTLSDIRSACSRLVETGFLSKPAGFNTVYTLTRLAQKHFNVASKKFVLRIN